jgi:hypothetical protein
MHGLLDPDHAAISCNEFITVPGGEYGGTVQENPSELAHAVPFPEVQPAAGRSNHTCT